MTNIDTCKGCTSGEPLPPSGRCIRCEYVSPAPVLPKMNHSKFRKMLNYSWVKYWLRYALAGRVFMRELWDILIEFEMTDNKYQANYKMHELMSKQIKKAL